VILDAIKLRILQGDPIVHNVKNAVFPKRFRGLPVIQDKDCPENCRQCLEICPNQALSLNPLTLDLGKCSLCGQCAEICPQSIIHFSNDYHLAVNKRENLFISKSIKKIAPEKASQLIKKYFGQSLKLRQVSAGGCNGCELELNALSNVNFDMGRYGVEFTASPRHADGIVITGPITRNMAKALEIAYNALPSPKIIILMGVCAISGGVFQDSKEIQRQFFETHKIDLYMPGCPTHPLTFINGLLDFFEKKE